MLYLRCTACEANQLIQNHRSRRNHSMYFFAKHVFLWLVSEVGLDALPANRKVNENKNNKYMNRR